MAISTGPAPMGRAATSHPSYGRPRQEGVKIGPESVEILYARVDREPEPDRSERRQKR